MSTNCSSLSIRARDGVTPERIEACIVASYEARGARVIGRTHREDLDREAEPPARAPLGVAVGPVSDGWVTVIDSFGYTSDAHLAGDLARELGTTVFRYTVAEVASYESLERFGPVLDAREAPGDTTQYRHLDASAEGFRFLVLDDVTSAAYAHLPSINVAAVCSSCDYDAGWSPGIDVPSAPREKDLYALRERREGSRWPRLLFQMRCPMCSDALGWARATLEAGILTGARPLSRPRVAAFDVALVSQRKLTEALSAPPPA